MPAFLTHWRILIETARNSQTAGQELGSLILDAAALRRRAHGWSTPPQTTPAGAVWDTGPLPQVNLRLPGSDISAMAFLGALAPDVMYYHPRYLHATLSDLHLTAPRPGQSETRRPPLWSDFFHRTHSGDLPILFLEQVALVPSPALRSQALAFTLGYLSHIAADIALHPWLNARTRHISVRRVPGPHCSLELLLDEYLAGTYFEHPRYNLWRQPWIGYIEPAAHDLAQPGTPTSQLLHLLSSATEIYELDGNQSDTFPSDFLQGLQGLRLFLSGRGRARKITLKALRKNIPSDTLRTLLNSSPGETENQPLEQVLTYATHLSVRFCQRAISYYTALRNTSTEASERSSRRTALVNDLRNWDLYTGYDTASDPATEALPLHNWVHFANLWEHITPDPAQPAILPG